MLLGKRWPYFKDIKLVLAVGEFWRYPMVKKGTADTVSPAQTEKQLRLDKGVCEIEWNQAIISLSMYFN